MDPTRFDDFLRLLTGEPSRRAVLRGLTTVVGLGLGAGRPPSMVWAEKKKKKKSLKLNEFDCVNVGGKCQGKDHVCCSGMCDGEKPKKGKPDRSRCIAHDTGTGCVAGQQVGFCGGTSAFCTTSLGGSGLCDTTTGKAPYCTGDGECFACQRDPDCVPICGQRAACVRCATGCAATGGTVCVGPAGGICDPPIAT